MNTPQMRIAVAECLGWDFPKELVICSKGVWGFRKDSPSSEKVPDFPNDLNACAEMEATLNDIEYNRYGNLLHKVCNDDFHELKKGQHFSADPMSATALQRCEAFLRVKGRWV